jgi:hypothetical protein
MNRRPRIPLCLETLETRDCPAVTATLSAGVLLVQGDAGNNQILVADANGDGTLEVTSNGQTVTVQGGTPLKSAIGLISVDGGRGDDTIIIARSVNTLDSSGGLLRSPDTRLLGGDGNDTLNPLNGGIVGGLAGVVSGVVVGPVVGNSFMDGGKGNDTLISGFGEDTILGRAGADTYVWNPGTIDDIVDLGAGNDTGIIIGNDGANDAFSLTALANGDVLFQRTNLVNFSVFFSNTETISLRPGSGDDSVTIGNLSAAKALTQVFIDGGAGADRISVARQGNGQVGSPKVTIAADPADLVTFGTATPTTTLATTSTTTITSPTSTTTSTEDFSSKSFLL